MCGVCVDVDIGDDMIGCVCIMYFECVFDL